jgi:hypothetical protein
VSDLVNWPNRRFFVRMSNGTEFKATNVIHKRCRKDKKESDYVIAFETVFVIEGLWGSLLVLEVRVLD